MAVVIPFSPADATIDRLVEFVTPDMLRVNAQILSRTGSEVTMIPQNRVHLEEGKAESMLKLFNLLEDSDDVQNVYANFDIDDDVLERLSA